jgi:hypothetical protein
MKINVGFESGNVESEPDLNQYQRIIATSDGKQEQVRSEGIESG